MTELITTSEVLEWDIVGFYFVSFPNPIWSNGNLMSNLREKPSFPNHFHVGLYADCVGGILSNTELKTELIWYLYCVVAMFIPVPVQKSQNKLPFTHNEFSHLLLLTHCWLDFLFFGFLGFFKIILIDLLKEQNNTIWLQKANNFGIYP